MNYEFVIRCTEVNLCGAKYRTILGLIKDIKLI